MNPFEGTPLRGRHPDWQELYARVPAERLPWHSAALDPDLEGELERRALRSGRFLDVGTGAGHQAVALARRGFTVTGTDLSPAAITQAEALEGSVQFVVDDVRDTALREIFDFAFDRGLLHVLEESERQRFAETMAALLRPGGLLFLKCFSDEEREAPVGPTRFARRDLTFVFEPAFAVLSCERTIFHGPLPHKPRAWFAVLERR